MNTRYLSAIALIFVACGGGSSDTTSQIDGTWSGDKIYGGASCTNGPLLGVGAGAGSIVGELNLEVVGSDTIGSEVTAIDGSCTLQGARTESGFTVKPVSGCAPELVSLTLELLEANAAAVTYHSDPTKVPAEPGETICVAHISAAVTR